MATIKTTYVAQDGKEFLSAAECDRHDAALALDAKLNAYVDQAKFKDTVKETGLKTAKSRLKKTLLNFLLWDAGHAAPADSGEVAEAEAEAEAEVA